MSDWWNQPTQSEVKPDTAPAESPAVCPWCGAPATPNATTYCGSCGAVMAQREDLGGVMVPGVTGVDPAMAQAGRSSALLRAQSGMATVSAVGSVAGSSAGMFVAAAMLAKDHFAAEPQHARPEELGTPSQAALDMARRLNEGIAPGADATEPGAGTAWPPDGEAAPGSGDPWAIEVSPGEADPWTGEPNRLR